jgi:hypothetical protein
MASAGLNVAAFAALLLVMRDTLPRSARLPFRLKNAHPFAFVGFFRRFARRSPGR